ncbi:Type II secretory pathway component ExeA (predicted ATPase)-like protein [Desulforamulus reducens MI-1]|uniref:Type II secretory pathway component ExeA (Predicted ATPase)-like protein n=2 Tax=Desulforamulus TaxID=2916693 RepID=A4J6B2_DESRM|nr:Type II secretory pathway component ExeA (predicted ATPase)-like protein [Desulforamulus reducens MI-1]
MLHRHGKYNRHAYTPEDQSHIPIYRFICPNPNCRKTTALLPAFLKEHHPISFDIQEKVIRQQAEGKTLVQLSGELLRHLGEETPFSITKAKRLFDEALMARTAQGGKELVIILDEAQDISSSLLLELRFARNQQMDSLSLFTLILVGQPELRRTLRMNKFEAITQRIQLRYHLTGLMAEETATYICHQMKTASLTTPLFSDSAIKLIHTETKGIPRLINSLCSQALYDAKRRNSDVIEESMIGRILADAERQRGTVG